MIDVNVMKAYIIWSYLQDKTIVIKRRRLIIKLGKQLAGGMPGEDEEPKREIKKVSLLVHEHNE